jgi:hypothetical protein
MAIDLKEEARKRRTTPVYSSTYDNKYSNLPNTSIINENSNRYTSSSMDWEKDWETYSKTMKSKLISPEDKITEVSPKKEPCCSKPEKYKNGFNTLKFWSCKNCGADLGDIND